MTGVQTCALPIFDGEAALLKIYAVPGQADGFRQPEPGKNHHLEQRPISENFSAPTKDRLVFSGKNYRLQFVIENISPTIR